MESVGAVMGGGLVGLFFWFSIMRPMMLDNHERRRRKLGLPAKRELPEDRS